MKKTLLVDRWTLARAFTVHPATIASWLREGLAAARVQAGAPQTPALFDAARAVAWFNAVKVKPRGWPKPVALADLEAAATNPPKSEAMTMLEQSFSDALTQFARKTPRHGKKVKTR